MLTNEVLLNQMEASTILLKILLESQKCVLRGKVLTRAILDMISLASHATGTQLHRIKEFVAANDVVAYIWDCICYPNHFAF
ncbi:unnamed protein product [Sphenostylis stenocarpa]|uniref:Uncharacterized protein n=1 Tax=Sphenostylis stenocarpa TaxID=92480 RepID=A0AA86TP63_9FABA|nr:unnamed protein product [Sphenostylis stenocarpa]